MNRWKEALATPQTSIRDVIQRLDASSLQIVLVVDENNRLLGTVTDGDVRRGILKSLALTEPVQKIMNAAPTVARADEDRERLLAIMRRTGLHHVPLVDGNNHLVGLETLDELIQTHPRHNWVVLMAGGLGSRLYPLTANCPKPMLNVGNKPLLVTILEKLVEYGFQRFYISVNYMSEIVKSYFGDGSHWGIDIRYLQEEQKLGTAGALSLMQETPVEPLLVMNGDLLTKVNFSHLLDFHTKQRALGTMCVREYDFQIPYGVVRIEKDHITDIEEKPTQRLFVNAGIYVLEPEALHFISPNTFIDMTMLFDKMIKQRKATAAFPVREYWLDVGHMDDLVRANAEYTDLFK